MIQRIACFGELATDIHKRPSSPPHLQNLVELRDQRPLPLSSSSRFGTRVVLVMALNKGSSADRCRENVEPLLPQRASSLEDARSHPVSSVACNDQHVRR
jgi:hypothetical protein